VDMDGTAGTLIFSKRIAAADVLPALLLYIAPTESLRQGKNASISFGCSSVKPASNEAFVFCLT